MACPVSAPQAFADQYGGQRMVLVTVDGNLMRDIPEAGSVRIVIDNQGRRLLIDNWNQVIGFEIPAWQYQQQSGVGRQRDAARFPERPLPPRQQFRRDDFASMPESGAGIERRDLNPMTGTVPDAPDIIKAPTVETPPAKAEQQHRTTPKAPALSKAQVAALQVYLDRNGISPGVIDGRMGSNVNKAIDAWEEATGERIDPADTDLVVSRLAAGGGLAFTTYTITAEDAAGPFVASIPTDYAEKAQLERLAYTSTLEMLAERFHMDEAYLKALNPDVDFTLPGVQIKVVNIGPKKTGVVTRIIADKGRKQVRAYDANGKLLAAYPATIGSSDTPSPSGDVTIERIAHNPGYTYNPKINFKQGNNDKILQVPPGPNGPVGTIWIALSKPTYGIHGTPEPSAIGKTQSHGCVRLTNWDAEELAGMVTPGVNVSFIE
ncbi:L,D-transpeptidase [Hoeflea sp. YIM 152468]|uniref:L,D-transpeptidase n=1 Tax=Hoeflea sp. YIM 152468 TaxID=3031759 RepID=UPI0023DCE5CC|nr:L,D-transpeptidase [Hoeflea sp. YIM 152468]MDF1607664.1 L,D-transpeptidase [Hoeflea sp. YIM 152468]